MGMSACQPTATDQAAWAATDQAAWAMAWSKLPATDGRRLAACSLQVRGEIRQYNMAHEGNKRRKIDSSIRDEAAASMSDVLKLNVGGQAYVTLRSTLCDDVNSMLFSKFSPDSAFASPAEVDGMIFIDRDPNCFKYVLNFLRCGCKAQFDPKDVDLKQLAAEADYFGLVALKEFCDKEQKVRDKKDGKVLSQKKRMDAAIVKIAEEVEKQSGRTADYLVARSISSLGGNIDRVGSAIQAQTITMKHEAKKIASAVENMAHFTETQSDYVEKISCTLDAIDDAGKDVIKSIDDVGVALVGYSGNSVYDAVNNLSESVTAKVEGCMDKGGDIVIAMEDLGRKVEDIADKGGDIVNAVEDLGRKVEDIADKGGEITDAVEDMGSKVKDIASSIEYVGGTRFEMSLPALLPGWAIPFRNFP